jgi:hypothetical protein
MRRLQEMRDASDLILQFGPYKGSTLAQVAMSNPEYIRQLMRSAQRPEVRAAAGRLVQALDAAPENARLRTPGSALQIAHMSRQKLNCERCSEFARELLELQYRVRAYRPAEMCRLVPPRSGRSKIRGTAQRVTTYVIAFCCFARVRSRLKLGHPSGVSGVERV